MRFVTSLQLVYTNKCPLECTHCVVEAAPIQRGKMPYDVARGLIESASRIGFDKVGFTGGEPLLYWKEIRELAALAAQLGVPAAIVTSAAVGKHWDSVKAVFEALFASGLERVTLSMDGFHEEQYRLHGYDLDIPSKLIAFCNEQGKPIKVRSVATDDDDDDSWSADAQALVKPGNTQVVPLIGFGRAAKMNRFVPFSDHNVSCGNANRIIVDWNGDAFTCCGPLTSIDKSTSPLYLGNVNDTPFEVLAEKAESRLMARAIGTAGFAFLVEQLEPEARTRIEDAGFPTKCDLCLSLTNSREIVAHLEERLSERENKMRIVQSALAFKAAKVTPRHHGEPGGADRMSPPKRSQGFLSK